ncbi:MAG: crossover junction endodeoxyribonuclease RuvC [Acidimicrobiia bacterium]
MFAPRVLGIDPGLTRCGFAVVAPRGAQRPKLLTLGVIRTDKSSPLATRLAELAAEFEALLDEHRPTAVAVERVFFQANARTAMSVAQASGLALAAAARRGIDVAEYTPNAVKLAVAGYGAADKAQVQRMVRQRLGLRATPRPADAADAAALALCHLATIPGRAA